MIIVDTELKRRAAQGRPIRFGMIGVGFTARRIARTTIGSVPGMRLAAVAGRAADRGRLVYTEAGGEAPKLAGVQAEIEQAVADGRNVVTEDALALCRAEGIDAVLDATGSLEFGARVAMEAITHGKHFVTNSELNATVGPILKVYADKAGVIISGCEGDQPAAQLNLHRFVTGVGMRPLVCGNIKGLQDRYRTPATQEKFSAQWGLNPRKAAGFADGTKISFEQAEVANATGMKVAIRGMLGYAHDGWIDDLRDRHDVDELKRLGGIVDYALGAQPGPGVYVFAAHDDPVQRTHLRYCKLGDGPLYSFCLPFHLMTMETHLSIARAVLFRDASIAPLGGQVVDVITAAKRDLAAGEILDAPGEFTTCGLCENAEIVRRDRLLPIGLSEGCRLTRAVAKDQIIAWDDVEAPADATIHRLRQEQDRFPFPSRVAP